MPSYSTIITRHGGSYTVNDTFSIIMTIRVIFCIRPPMLSYSTILTRHGGSYTENDTFSVIMGDKGPRIDHDQTWWVLYRK